MDKEVILTVKEQKRLRMIVELDAGRVTGQETAEVLGLSLRQVRRLLAAFREEGAAGLAHGNRSREPANKTPASTRERIQELARERYWDYNDTHFTEQLEKEHQIVVSRPTAHRLRRERYSQRGMLLQLDGSPHDWLEGRGPWLTLLVAIDDATSEVPAGVFREEGGGHGQRKEGNHGESGDSTPQHRAYFTRWSCSCQSPRAPLPPDGYL